MVFCVKLLKLLLIIQKIRFCGLVCFYSYLYDFVFDILSVDNALLDLYFYFYYLLYIIFSKISIKVSGFIPVPICSRVSKNFSGIENSIFSKLDIS